MTPIKPVVTSRILWRKQAIPGGLMEAKFSSDFWKNTWGMTSENLKKKLFCFLG